MRNKELSRKLMAGVLAGSLLLSSVWSPVWAEETDAIPVESQTEEVADQVESELVESEVAETVEEEDSEEAVSETVDEAAEVSEPVEPVEEAAEDVAEDSAPSVEDELSVVALSDEEPVVETQGEVTQSGTVCNGNIQWTCTDDVLTFSGTGDLTEFPRDVNITWYDYSEDQQKRIRKVIIGDGITGIGDEVFYYAEWLSEVSLADSIQWIGEYAFYGTALVSVVLPKNLVSIHDYAFGYCSQLKEITFNDTLQSIGDGVFVESNLEKVIIPDSVKELGTGIFSDCISLKEVTLGKNVKELSSDFSYCTSLESIVIPDGVTSIGGFNGCTSLKSITFPASSLTYLSGFDETAFTSIVIPESVEEFYGFYNCKDLKDITFKGNTVINDYVDYNLGYIYDNVTDGPVPNAGVTIHGIYNSNAHDYARNNGFSFDGSYLPAPEIVKTVNGENYLEVWFKNNAGYPALCKYSYGNNEWFVRDYTDKEENGLSCFELSYPGCEETLIYEIYSGSYDYNDDDSYNFYLMSQAASGSRKGPGHKWEYAYCNDIYDYYCCNNCWTEKSVKHTHQWRYDYTTNPDVYYEGAHYYICSGCGEYKEVTIPKLKPVLNIADTTVVLKKKQSTSALNISIAEGDYITEAKSSNEKIVKADVWDDWTVDNRIVIKAQNKTGKATVTISLKSGLKRSITVKVQSGVVQPTKVVLNAPKLTLKAGTRYQLKASYGPFTCVQKPAYTSSKKKIATVGKKNGLIVAKKKGSTKITCKVGKKKSTCKVTVY